MKKLILLSVLLLICHLSKAQFASDCEVGDAPVVVLDSFYFESGNVAKGMLVIDTTYPNNIWQVGTVQKAGFISALSGTHALQTDTLNPYPVGNESAAVLYLDTSLWLDDHFSVTFWHYYDTDTLTDSCLVQISNLNSITSRRALLLLYLLVA